MKPSMSRKKRKASEGKCTNPKSKRRLNKDKQPSPGSLPIEKNKQPSHGSLPIEKNKQPSLSKKVVRSPVLNNVVMSFLARREKRLSH